MRINLPPKKRKPPVFLLRSSRVWFTLSAALFCCFTEAVSGQSLPLDVEFGVANDRLAGFNRSTVDSNHESWAQQTNSLRYIVDDPDGGPDFGVEGGNMNASLLRRISLDRSAGSSYRIEGLVRLIDGYADDNNRLGLYLFGSFADLGAYPGSPGEAEAGALSLQYNTDSGGVEIYEGIDLNQLASETKDAGFLAADDSIFADTRMRFAADLRFAPDDKLEVVFTLIDGRNDATTVAATVQASDYSGDYFGFASRARNRGVSSSDRDAPFTLEYEQISVTKTDIPEPLSAALLVGCFAGFMVFRCRRA
jgi:hypothetical protein